MPPASVVREATFTAPANVVAPPLLTVRVCAPVTVPVNVVAPPPVVTTTGPGDGPDVGCPQRARRPAGDDGVGGQDRAGDRASGGEPVGANAVQAVRAHRRRCVHADQVAGDLRADQAAREAGHEADALA